MRKSHLLCVFLLLAIAIASYTPAYTTVSAAGNAVISGTIKNTSNRTIANPRVWLGYRCYDWDTDQYSGFVQESIANRSGVFNFNNITCPGNWNFADAVVRVFANGYESTVIYEGTIAQSENLSLGTIYLPSRSGAVLKWAGLRYSSYAVFGYTEPGNWPDGINPRDPTKVNKYVNADGVQLLPWKPLAGNDDDWHGYFPNTFQWAGGMNYMAQGTSAVPVSLFTVGKIIYDLRDGFGETFPGSGVTNHKSELWFQFSESNIEDDDNDSWIHYRTQAPTFKTLGAEFPEGWFHLDQVERVEFMCDHSPDLHLYLAVEAGKFVDMPGEKTMKGLMQIVFDKFGHIPCVKGFAVDAEFYQGGGSMDNVRISGAKAKQWEQDLIAVAGPGYRLMLKHFDLNKLPHTGASDAYFGNIIFVNSSQGYDSYAQFLDRTTLTGPGVKTWANSFVNASSFADVGYQFGYSGWDKHKDYGWWKNLASTTQGAPHHIRNGIVSSITNNGQGVAALWVDMNLWIAMPDIFSQGIPIPVPIFWEPNVAYEVGDQALYNGHWYEVIQAHTSQIGWEPPKVPALWQKAPSGSTEWEPNVPYKTGDEVTYNSKTYVCRQAHTSLMGWEPSNVPALWLLK